MSRGNNFIPSNIIFVYYFFILLGLIVFLQLLGFFINYIN